MRDWLVRYWFRATRTVGHYSRTDPNKDDEDGTSPPTASRDAYSGVLAAIVTETQHAEDVLTVIGTSYAALSAESECQSRVGVP
jgi:hypothetical protein